MIMLNRLNGQAFALNPDLLERAEATPDTVLTLCDGAKILVAETVSEVIERVRDYRVSVVSRAHQLETEAQAAPFLHVVPQPYREK